MKNLNHETDLDKARKKMGCFGLVILALIFIIGLWVHLNFTAIETNPSEVKTVLSDKNLANHDVQVYFYKPGCEHCKLARWHVLSEETFNGNPKVKYVNVNVLKPENQKYLAKYGISKTPTMVHLVKGQEQDRQQLVNGELK